VSHMMVDQVCVSLTFLGPNSCLLVFARNVLVYLFICCNYAGPTCNFDFDRFAVLLVSSKYYLIS
jgi:hypothetical protein